MCVREFLLGRWVHNHWTETQLKESPLARIPISWLSCFLISFNIRYRLESSIHQWFKRINVLYSLLLLPSNSSPTTTFFLWWWASYIISIPRSAYTRWTEIIVDCALQKMSSMKHIHVLYITSQSHRAIQFQSESDFGITCTLHQLQ